MDPIILHHYPLSLFAEKVRRILAYKKIPWRAVEQPMMVPKPDLTALTGGYRRIPVLQIGADVYCDTALIARRLERLRPDPSCMPAGQDGAAAMIEDWADHRFAFQCTSPVIAEILPELPPGIIEDRARMFPGFSEQTIRATAPHAFAQAKISLDRLDGQLRDRPFLLGETFSVADAACFHPVWFIQRSTRLFADVNARPSVAAWFARIEGFGPGDVRPMTPAEALAIARETEPVDVDGGNRGGFGGVAPGDTVSIVADDYGPESTAGTVVRIDANEIVVRRRDPRVGNVAVHFPRAGYRVMKT